MTCHVESHDLCVWGPQEQKKQLDSLERSLAAVEEELALKRTEVGVVCEGVRV